jgi:putative membrane protein
VQLIIKKENKVRLNHFIEWLLYLLGDIIVFILITNLFKSVYIDTKHSYIYSALIVLVISILNKTIKPVLVTLTIPITGLTLGLFYPFINLFILKLTDWILGPHFQLTNIWIALILAIILSVMNIIVENGIIKPIIKRVKQNG